MGTKILESKGIIAVSLLIINFGAYFLGCIELNRLYQSLLLIIPIISIINLYEHIIRDVLPEIRLEP